MPPALHVKVTEEQLGEGRLLVVGDVHGCKDELAELLAKANYTHGQDNLILAGDLVDKGPYPIEVCISLGEMHFFPFQSHVNKENSLLSPSAFTC